MDDLREQIELLESSANLSTSIDHVQKAIDMLTAARANIAAGKNPISTIAVDPANQHKPDPKTAPLTLAKLQDPFKKSLDTVQKDLKPIYAGLNKYGKTLDKVRFLCPPIQHHRPNNHHPRNSKISPSLPPTTMRYPRTPHSSIAPSPCTSYAKVNST
jgi:hypothetical protein